MGDPTGDAFAERITSRKSLSAECFEWLKQQIYTGRFPAGSHIREKEVASILGLSRSPIREAFARLAEFGLGEYVPNRGFRVITFDVRRVREVGQVRLALENLGVELAAKTATDEQIAGLGRILEETERRLAENEDEYPLELDLHTALLTIADNRTLTSMLDRIDATVRAMRTWSGRRSHRPQEALAEHRAIYDGLLARDREAAVRAMTDHIQKSTDNMIECIRDDALLEGADRQEPEA